VHVARPSGGKPVVALAMSMSTAGSNVPAVLDRLGKIWSTEQFQCTTLVRSGEYQFLPVEAPNVAPSELKSAISWLLKDMIDFPIDEATVDVLSVPQDRSAPQRSRAMYAIATKMTMVAERQRMFEEAKLPLSVIDVPEMAQRNIAALIEEGDQGIAMVSFDEDGGLLTFSSNGELCIARRFDVVRAQLIDADRGMRENCHERVALEIQRSLDHFGRQFSSTVVSKLDVAPVGDDDGGLTAFLQENLDVKVEALNLESLFNLSAIPELKQLDNQARFFSLLGAALRVEEKTL